MTVAEQTQPTAAPTPRLEFIDGLRGLAMLMVLIFHCWGHGGQWRLDVPLGHHRLNLAAPLSLGYTGVHLFLVLSGFCLYWPFVKGGSRREPTLKEFAWKRCRRILPPYYVALLLFGGLGLLSAIGHHAPAQSAFFGNWLWLHTVMLHNTQPGYIMSVDPPLWSLALEFQLYILFPVFVEAFRRVPAPVVLIAVLLFCAAFRGWTAHALAPLPLDQQTVFVQSVFSRCFEFALGMFTARLVAGWYADGPTALGRMRPGGVLAAFAVLALLDMRVLHLGIVADAKWGLLYAALLVAASRPGLLNKTLSRRALVACGVFSYSVYLIHEPLLMGLGSLAQTWHLTPATTGAVLLLAGPMLLGLGFVFHCLFEKPFMGGPNTRPRERRDAAPQNGPEPMPGLLNPQ